MLFPTGMLFPTEMLFPTGMLFPTAMRFPTGIHPPARICKCSPSRFLGVERLAITHRRGDEGADHARGPDHAAEIPEPHRLETERRDHRRVDQRKCARR